MFTEDLSIKIRNWKQPKCPSIGEWLNHGISTSGNMNRQLNKTKKLKGIVQSGKKSQFQKKKPHTV